MTEAVDKSIQDDEIRYKIVDIPRSMSQASSPTPGWLLGTLRKLALDDAAWAAHCWVCDHMADLNSMSPAEISREIQAVILNAPEQKRGADAECMAEKSNMPNTVPTSRYPRLQAVMAAQGVTPNRLSEAIDRHRSYLNDLFTGKKETVSARDWQKIADFLGVPVYDINETHRQANSPNTPIPDDSGHYKLVVVPSHVTDEMAAEVFSGWRVVRPGESLGGLLVGYILVLCAAKNRHEQAWFDIELRHRIRPNTIVRNWA